MQSACEAPPGGVFNLEGLQRALRSNVIESIRAEMSLRS